MRKTISYDAGIFEPEAIKQTKRLVTEKDKLNGEVPQELKDRVREANTVAEDCKLVGASYHDARSANLKLYHTKRAIQLFKVGQSQARDKLSRQLEELDTPPADEVLRVRDESRRWLASQVIFRRIETKKDSFTDKKTVAVITNLPVIEEVRDLLTQLGGVRNMLHSPLGDMKTLVEDLVEKINAIDLKKVATVTMSRFDYEQQDEGLMRRPATENLSPSQQGVVQDNFLEHNFARLKQLVAKL